MPSSKPSPFAFIDLAELREELNFIVNDIYAKLDFALSLDGKGVMVTLPYGGLGQDLSALTGLLYVINGESGVLIPGTGLAANLTLGSLYLNVTTKGDLLVGTADKAMSRLGITTIPDGYVLRKGGAHATGLEWAADLASTILDANSILKADVDHTPIQLVIDEERVIGRLTGGVITGLTAADVKTFVGLPSIINLMASGPSTIQQQNTTEIIHDTDDILSLTTADFGKLIVFSHLTDNLHINLPAINDTHAGSMIRFIKLGSGTIVIDPASADCIDDKGVYAYGTVTVTGTPVADQNLIIGGHTFLFKAARSGTDEITIDANNTNQAHNIETAVNLDMTNPDTGANASHLLGIVTITANRKSSYGNGMLFSTTGTGVAVDGVGTLHDGSDGDLTCADTGIATIDLQLARDTRWISVARTNTWT